MVKKKMQMASTSVLGVPMDNPRTFSPKKNKPTFSRLANNIGATIQYLRKETTIKTMTESFTKTNYQSKEITCQQNTLKPKDR